MGRIRSPRPRRPADSDRPAGRPETVGPEEPLPCRAASRRLGSARRLGSPPEEPLRSTRKIDSPAQQVCASLDHQTARSYVTSTTSMRWARLNKCAHSDIVRLTSRDTSPTQGALFREKSRLHRLQLGRLCLKHEMAVLTRCRQVRARKQAPWVHRPRCRMGRRCIAHVTESASERRIFWPKVAAGVC